MEKIIYNSKLKKFFISTLIFMMLFNAVFPSIVLATEEESITVTVEGVTYEIQNGFDENTDQCVTATGCIQAVIYALNTKGTGTSDSIRAVTGEHSIKTNQAAELEKKAKEYIRSYLTHNPDYKNIIANKSESQIDDLVNSIYNYCNKKPELFKAVAYAVYLYNGTDDDSKIGWNYDYSFYWGLTPAKVEEITKMDSDEIGGVDTNLRDERGDEELPDVGFESEYKDGNGHAKAEGSIQDVITSMTYWYTDLGLENTKYAASLYEFTKTQSANKTGEVEKNVKDSVKSTIKAADTTEYNNIQLTEELLEKIYRYCAKDKTLINVSVRVDVNLDEEKANKVTLNQVKAEITKTDKLNQEKKDELVNKLEKKWSKWSIKQKLEALGVVGYVFLDYAYAYDVTVYLNKLTPSLINEINKMKLEDLKEVEIDVYEAAGTKDYDFTPDDKNSANAGGILLSPVVALINFIADAIINIVGSVMDPDGGDVFDRLVLTDKALTAADLGYTKTTPYTVNVDSFIPELGLAILGKKEISYQYPNLTYTPEEIFAGKIDLLSIDFISGKNYEGEANKDTGWNNIRTTIAQWYQILRMIAIIGLLSVLIYTGIKIILSANANDKAKYKQWIMDWFMAVAILFSMHIIMAFIISVTNEFSKLMTQAFEGIQVNTSDGNTFVTNLMGLTRFMVQSENFYIKVGYEVMYIALMFYTIKFTFVYLKRVLNMAFLTLVAPVVALMYPIDKLNDGRAQAFDMWLKEYIFNALLQPMHCILYYVLVGSAVGIAASNPLYGIVVLAFMSEAERLLKKIFGFDKASGGTLGGSTAGAFAAGAIASNIGKMARLAKGNAGKGGAGGADKNNFLDNPKPTDKPGMDAFLNGSAAAAYNASREKENQGNYNDPADVEQDFYSQQRQERLDLGMSEQEVDKEMMDSYGVTGRNTTENPPQNEPNSNKEPQGDIHAVAAKKESSKKEKSRFAKGAGAVVRKLAKPVWDADKSNSYNFKRLAKGVAKGVGGFALGTAAAAVQAGISITDGKYNPLEGIAAYTAGSAGFGRIGAGIGGVIDTYREGANAGDKEAQMARAQARFRDRDDVIAFNKKNFAGREEEAMQRQRDHYLTAGVTDLKEMKSGMKYADSLVKNSKNMTAEQADKMAAATIDFKKTLQDQGQLKAVYDKGQQEKYIQSMVSKAADADKANVRKQYENAFRSVAAYDAANK